MSSFDLWRRARGFACRAWRKSMQGRRLSSAISRNREAADALDAVVKEMLNQ